MNKDVGTIMRWTTTNATSLSIDNDVGGVSPVSSGSVNIYPQATTTYTGTVTGTGGTAYCNRTVTIAPEATASISVSSSTINENASSTLTWSTESADEGVYISNIGWVSVSGSTPVSLSTTTTYTLTAYGFGGDATDSATLTVLASCTLDDTTLASGESATFYSQETTPQGTTCTSVSQERTCTDGTLSGSDTYQYSDCACTPSYTCTGVDGQTIQETNASCAVSNIATCVLPQFCSDGLSTCRDAPLGFVSGGGRDGHLEASPSLVRSSDTSTLYWNIENAASCSVTGDNNDLWNLVASGTNGQETSRITQATTFTLYCTGLASGFIEESVTVNIAPTFRER